MIPLSDAQTDSPARFPSVLFVAGCTGDTVRYRCDHPREQLQRHGVRAENRLWTDPQLFGDVLDYDVFVLHRVMYKGFIPALIELLHALGKVVIFDTDDLIFEPTMARYDSRLAALSADLASRYRQSIRLHGQTLDHCDYALTTTEYLAGWLRRRGKQTYVSRNALSDELLRLSEEAYRKRRPEGERVVVAYLSGSPSHDRDFAVAAPAVLSLMTHHPQVQLRVFGHLSLDGSFSSFGERVQRVPYMAWQALPAAIGEVDVNLAPLELDNPFCRSKSELKYFEAGAVGVPTVATPTEAFRFAITHGENGLLASTDQEWLSGLELLVTHAGRRREMGEAARRHVRTHYTSAVRGTELVTTLSEIWDDRSARTQATRVRRPARHVIAHMLGYLESLVLYDEVQRYEEVLLRLADEINRRQRRPWHRLWAWGKRRLKQSLRMTYEHRFFEQACTLAPELTAGQQREGHFVASAPNLYRLDVPFATYQRVNTADVVLHLREAGEAERDLATVSVSAALLGDNQPYRFIFEPIPDSQGRAFTILLESPGAFAGNAVSPWLVQGSGRPVFRPFYLPGDAAR